MKKEEEKDMKWLWISLLGTIMLAAPLTGAGCTRPATDSSSHLPISTYLEAPDVSILYGQQQVGIWVSGEGKVWATPDTTLLTLGVEAEAKSVAQAQKDAAEAMNRVIKTLRDRGVVEKDIQTQRFSIQPVQRWIEKENREEIIGYRVTNIVVAKIRQIEKTGDIIDAAAEAGGDLIRINNISFAVDDPTQLYNQAREKALQDAMNKAQQIARVTNTKLGKPIYISEAALYTPPVIRDYALKALEAAPPTPVSGGELEFRVTVQMVYKID